MLKHLFLAFILCILCSQTLCGKERTIDNPSFIVRNTSVIEINKIVMSDTETVFFIDAFFDMYDWIRIGEEAYLRAGSTKLTVKSGEGIGLGKEFWKPESGRASFKLIFPPLPKGTKSVDFVESDCKTCFKIWGIQTDGKPLPPLVIDKEWANMKHNYNTPVETPEFEKGEAILSGKFLEYQPAMLFEGVVKTNNIISGEQTEVKFNVNDDGTFMVKVPLIAPTQVVLSCPLYYSPIILAPNQETNVLINLREVARRSSRLRWQETRYGQEAFTRGAYAALNDELMNDTTIIDIVPQFQESYDVLYSDINGMTPAQYKDYITTRYQNAIAREEALPRKSDLFRQLQKMKLNISYISLLNRADYHLQKAYRKANNLKKNDPIPNFRLDKYPDDYYAVLSSLELNNSLMLLVDSYSSLLSEIQYLNFGSKEPRPLRIVNYLINSGELNNAEIALLKEFVAATKVGQKFEKIDEMMKISQNHSKLLDEYTRIEKEELNVKDKLPRLIGTDKGLLFDLMEVQQITTKLQEFEPLTNEQLSKLNDLPAFYKEIVIALNDDLLKKIEENKRKAGYRVHEAPQVADEELFEAIISRYKGKVVFVDFWATWCGPCLKAMEMARPVKAALGEKEIVYLYLTDETSPLNTWKNMISDIHGDHIRMTNSQFGYLSSKFKVTSVPFYMIIDKEGKQVHFQVGFMGADNMKSMLLKEADK